MIVKGMVMALDTYERNPVQILIDSRCMGSCINSKFVQHHKINTRKLDRPIPIYNANSMPNLGVLEEVVQLKLWIDG